jgi:glycerol kinase
MTVVIAIDAGTTGVRAYAVDDSGTPAGWSYREFTQHFPRPGWVEHDPVEIWEAVQTTLAELTTQLSQPIAAIGITDQRETIVAWSRSTGEPRHRAIVWQDRRTAERCDELVAAGHLPMIRRRTGLVLDPYFSGSKVEWLLRHGNVEADDDLAVGTIDSWLIWKLTGGTVHATDPSNASRTMLFDIREGRWSEELCDLFGVPLSSLPEVMPSCGRVGVTSSDCAAGAGIPISGIAGDQQSALFGQACFTPGMTKNTYGTGSFVLMNVGETCPDPSDGLLTTVAWQLPRRILGAGHEEPAELVTLYALEGAIFVTGAAVQWLRDGLGIIEDAAEIGPHADTVADSGGVVLVPAFAGLGAPWWDPYARGTIVGLTRGSGRAELARATVESMVFQTRDVVTAMARASGREIVELRVDGGASVMPLLLQLQADQLGVPVTRPTLSETTALGACYLAGLAEGVWSDIGDVSDRWLVDARVDPAGDPAVAEAAHEQWLRAVERSRNWAG